MRQLVMLAVGLALATATVVFVPTGGTAASRSSGPLLEDARAYAAHYEVSVSEAARRLRLQGRIGKLDADLMSSERDTFAGLWIRHKPKYRVIARFTRGGERTIRPYLESEPLRNLVEVRRASATLAELEAAQDRVSRLAGFLDVRGETGIDVPNNRVEVYVTDRRPLRTTFSEAGTRLPDEVATVRVEELLEPSADIYAGLRVTPPNGVYCTSGFSVRHRDGRRGITTAGHCAPRPGSGPMRHLGRRLALQGTGRTYGSFDVQWHTTPFADRARARDRSGYRHITGARGRLDEPYGSWVCHFGQGGSKPEYRCGRIVDRSFGGLRDVRNPNNTFIKVHNGKADIDDAGDSGGPWYDGRTALGIHSAGDRNHTAAYMSITYFSNLGLKVMKRR